MQWQDNTVLVTGAGGFIGSHLTERLVKLGARVRVFLRYTSMGRLGWLDDTDIKDQVEIITGDIADQDIVRRAVKGCNRVFHLAALIGIPYSYHAPRSYVQTNISGTLNILQAARDFDVERVIQTSTSEVYGTARYVPIDEAHPLQGQSPYSASKIGADKLAESYFNSFGLPVVVVRPFNTYGPRQSARAVIPTIITQVMAGKGVRLGNLHPTRDLNYVGNTVEGFVLAGKSDKAVGRVINIGTGKEISIGDLATMIFEILGTPADIQSEDARLRPRQSEVDRLCADNTLAKDLLGWQPQVSLKQGLGLTIEWIRQHLADYRPGQYMI